MQTNNYQYALVLVNVANIGTRTFSYLIPDELKQTIKVGQPVLVSFGTQGIINAFVVGFSNYLPDNIKAKSILEILDETPLFDLDYLKLLEWVANYYCCDLQTVLSCAVPMKFLSKSKRMVSICSVNNFKGNKTENAFIEKVLLKPISTTSLQKHLKIPSSKFYATLRKLQNIGVLKVENIIDEKIQREQSEKYLIFKTKEGANKRQLEILEALEPLGETKLIEFEKGLKTTRLTIKKLADCGFIEIIEKPIYRNPLAIFAPNKIEEFPTLSAEQQQALQQIISKQGTKQPIYLYGVTGSGKTEIYFNLIKNVLKEGKNVLFLAPEIALASQLTNRLAKRFGIEDVAIWHSSISDGERYDVWQKLKQNKIKILAGARSAVFAPLQNIGLIIIDEEHENSYKQTTPSPRYDARTVAKKLAEINNATLILGSATPDVNNYYFAKNSNNLVKLSNRFNNVDMAKVIVLNLNEEKTDGNNGIFSRTLINAIEKNLKEKKQTILLINRRGFSTFTTCQGCQTVIQCPKCAIPMIWHAADKKLKCHYCNHETDFPEYCPNCGSSALKRSGTGIQRVEEIAEKLFPDAKIARIDSDVLTKKYEHIDILKNFQNGEIDILIGTQMIAKGLDNPNVTIVGVISADSSFNLPDYRSCERGFQLLTQVAGRAGRGDFEGKVYFQTNNPEFYALKTAQEQNYENFYEEEIQSRLEFDYPPYSQILRLVLSSENNFRAEKSALEIALRLSEIIDKRGLSEHIIVLGPSPCVFERIRGEYRFQILIKNKLEEKGHMLITSFISKIKMPDDIKLIIDVDPSDIL
ncbi:primosomal protein N' [bacterium]|nr:primosomal protein N' [bacterium]